MPARAEAALATLVESRTRGEGLRVGVVAGELLAQVGDVDARARELRARRRVRARACPGRARLRARSARHAGRGGGRALARSGARALAALDPARWARVEARLALGRLEDALADVEHLEALARGARGKYAVWLRAGRAWAASGPRRRTREPSSSERCATPPTSPRPSRASARAARATGARREGVSLLDRVRSRSRDREASPIRPSCWRSRGRSPSASTICRRPSRDAVGHPRATPTKRRSRADSRDDGARASAISPARRSPSRDCATSPRRWRLARTTPARGRSSRCSSRPPRWSGANARDPLAAQRHLAVALCDRSASRAGATRLPRGRRRSSSGFARAERTRRETTAAARRR